VGVRKKTDEPTPDVDDDADDQEESSTAEQDVEPAKSEPESVSNVSASQSSPKKRTKADLEVGAVMRDQFDLVLFHVHSGNWFSGMT